MKSTFAVSKIYFPDGIQHFCYFQMLCIEQFSPAKLFFFFFLHSSSAGDFFFSLCSRQGQLRLQHNWTLNLLYSVNDAQWGIGGVN